MIKTFVEKHVMTWMFVAFLVMLGLVSYASLNVEETPKIDLPMVSVQVVYPGASPEDVEQDVLKEIEDVVTEVSNIKKVQSFAYNNYGLIMIEFNLGSDVNIKSIEVKDKVDTIVNNLPNSVEKPIVAKYDMLSVSVLDLVLRSSKHNAKYLREFADKTLKPMFSAISGISNIAIRGGKEREIKIELDSNLMAQHFVSILDVINTIKNYNVNFPGGSIKQDKNDISVRFFGEYQSVDDMAKLLITTPEGQKFPLSEIAKVSDGHKNIEEDSRFNSTPVVLLSLFKVSDGNAISIANQFNKMLPTFKNILQDGMSLEVANDTTTKVIQNTKGTIESIIIGMLLTILVLLLFTANFRTTLITSLVLPTSLIATLFLVKASDFTINSMSLLAMATVLGTLIANAIIIIERANELIKEGKDPETAAIEGTKDVTAAVMASSGTNLAVFIPIGFMGGTIGLFMKQFGLTVVYATLMSILISFTLTPMLIAKILKNRVVLKKSWLERLSDFINDTILNWYKGLFSIMFKFKKLTILFGIIVFVLCMKLGKYIGSEFVPGSDQNKIAISVKTPAGSSINKTTAKVGAIEARLAKYKEITSVVSKIGDNGVENASLMLNLTPSETRVADTVIMKKLIPELSDISDIELEISRGNSRTKSADITVDTYGNDYNKLIEYSEKIKKILEDSGYFLSVSSSYTKPKLEYRFIPNQEKLKFYGVSNIQLA
jgi:HAE1 family hydrophobic/amphiphilic exporter-1